MKLLKTCLIALAVLPLSAIAQSQTKLTVDDFAIKAGETKTLTVNLDNPDMTVTLVQFDLELPEGLSVAKDEDDEYLIEMTSRASKKHTLDYNYKNGRVLLSSSSNKTLSGTSGPIITIDLTAAATFETGTITLKNIEIVSPDNTAENPVVSKPDDIVINIVAQQTTVSIKADDLTMVYGDDVPELTYTVTDGEALGVPELSCDVTSESPVGTYPIVITEGTLTNDIKNLTNGTLTITKAPLTITAKSYTIQQGDAMPDFEVTYSGFKNNETEGVLITEPEINCTANDSSVPGEYDIVASNAEAENYDISYVDGKLTIEEASGIQTITFDVKAGNVYDMSGRRIRENATTLEGLSKGVYIFNGHKVVKE